MLALVYEGLNKNISKVLIIINNKEVYGIYVNGPALNAFPMDQEVLINVLPSSDGGGMETRSSVV